MSDRLALAHAIEDAGIERSKAENVASVIVRLVEGSVVTKAQLDAAKAELKADIQASNADIARAESALKAEIGRVEMTLKGEIAAVRTDITRLDGKVELVGSRHSTGSALWWLEVSPLSSPCNTSGRRTDARDPSPPLIGG